MTHILIICTANICRSPAVEAILHKRLEARGLKDWRVSSAGTWAREGFPAAPYSQEIVQERENLDLSSHRSRIVTADMLNQTNLVLCMTAGHAEALRAEFPSQRSKIYLLSEMSGPEYDVVDPYGGPRQGYAQMVTEVTQLIEQGLGRIIELAGE